VRPGDIEALETAEIGRRVPSGANRLVGEIVLKSRGGGRGGDPAD